MGIYDRDYSHDEYGHRRQMQFMMPSVTPVVKWLLIINVAVFVITFIMDPRQRIFSIFAVYPGSVGTALQLWRFVTYQFLHDGIGHVFFNMLVLFFFGPMLERLWGSKKFLKFYLICGAAGGVLYTILALAGILPAAPLVGASGAIYGMLAAGAILFPKMRVYVFGIFPLTMMTLVIIIAAVSVLTFLHGENVGGEAAHLAGMAAGVVFVLYEPWRSRIKSKTKRVKWESDINAQRAFQKEVDRILDKVHTSGITSLTRKEKNILREATEREKHYSG